MDNIRFASPMKDGRPIRCTEKTRIFAKESLDGKYGREALETMMVSLDDTDGLSPRKL